MVRAIHGPWAIIQAVAATDNGDQTLTTCSDHGFCIRFLKEFGVRALPAQRHCGLSLLFARRQAPVSDLLL